MADLTKKTGRLSTSNKQPIRSRGFLSHGGPVDGDGNLHKRSHGMLSHRGVDEKTPQELDAPKPRRPYALDSK
ncbi:hypothetical protein [Roseibium algae]|uniref:Uncharacterized protein n=1 Tax=Roseibium algae TaxID=3123038 RepID=A0ABU8TRV8_9HYPH